MNEGTAEIIQFPARFRQDTEQSLHDKLDNLAKMVGQNTRKKKEKKQGEYSEFKTNGVRKARAMDSIRSYDEFASMQKYFLDNDKIRDYAFWTIGVSLGDRVSDLTALKVGHILNADHTFKERVRILEKKTSKINNCIITESVRHAATKYLDSIGWDIELDDYLFKSQKKGKLTERTGWNIIASAARALQLPIAVGSHTMRKSFANIAICVSKSTIDPNAVAKVQILLNHDNILTTMKYLGVLDDMCDEDRIAVSDFILGRSEINELKIGGQRGTL